MSMNLHNLHICMILIFGGLATRDSFTEQGQRILLQVLYCGFKTQKLAETVHWNMA